MGKIATVYTGASDELLTMVRIALKKELGDNGFELLEYLDPSISDDMSSMGFVPMSAGIRMVDMYQKAVRDGAELIMTCCSSVGNIAKAAKPLYEMMGIPFLRIDESMAE